MKDTYNTYLRYKKIIKLLSKKEHTINYIIKKTKIPQATAFRIIHSLLKNNIIIISKIQTTKNCGRSKQVFKLKNKSKAIL